MKNNPVINENIDKEMDAYVLRLEKSFSNLINNPLPKKKAKKLVKLAEAIDRLRRSQNL